MSPRPNTPIASGEPRSPLDGVIAVGTVHRFGLVNELPVPFAVGLAPASDVLNNYHIPSRSKLRRDFDVLVALLTVWRPADEDRVLSGLIGPVDVGPQDSAVAHRGLNVVLHRRVDQHRRTTLPLSATT